MLRQPTVSSKIGATGADNSLRRGSWSRSLLPFALSLALSFLTPLRSAASDEVDPWAYAYAGQDHFYNLEYREALADFDRALAIEPRNPVFHNYVANTLLFQEMYRLGLLDGNLYDASNSFLEVKKLEPDPEQIAKLKATLARVRALCEARLKENSRDTEALYALGISYAIEGSYKFTIEKSWLDALRTGSRANEFHEKLLRLDPTYHDAKLVPGVYQYVMGSIPGGVKWLAFLFGYRGSRTRGLQLMQEAMTHGKHATSAAAFLLAVAYTRERYHQYSRQILSSLADYYPRNPLIRLEIARTYSREGNQEKALEAYVQVARDMERGRPGYNKLPRERLWYQIGVLYQKQNQWNEALDAYARVTEKPTADGLLKAYTGLRRGEIFLAQNHPDRARAEFERVAAMPYEEARRQAEERLRTLGR